MTVTVTVAVVGSAKLDPAYTMKPGSTAIGSLGTAPLAIRTLAPTVGGIDNRAVVTFAFPQSVRAVGFTITDIDSGSGTAATTFVDRVGFPSPGLPTVLSLGSLVTGSGTQSAPFQATSGNTNVGSTASTANVRLRVDSTLTSLPLYFWSGASGSQIHTDIWISDLTFSTC